MTSEHREPEESQILWRSPELSRIGTMLGPYRLLAPLGAGGMATVFAAQHIGLEKRVAVKVLREHLVVDGDLRRRFIREGILASRVRHPNVVDVTDVGEHRGHAYLVMEFLEGESLGARMVRDGAMPVERALDILLPIICGLAAAHRAGVVHRDVKPENIFLAKLDERREVSKLLDFGISRASTGARTTDDHIILGTAHYMAPEQARGADLDGRVDQYALAVVLYEAISGALPYVSDGSNVVELMTEAARGRALPLTARWPNAPEKLSDALAKALAGPREARHANIEDFGRQLLPFASSRAVRAFRELVDPAWSSMSIERPAPRSDMPSGVTRVPPTDFTRAEAPTLAHELPPEVSPEAGPCTPLASGSEATTPPRLERETLPSVPAARVPGRKAWWVGSGVLATAPIAALAAMLLGSPTSSAGLVVARDEPVTAAPARVASPAPPTTPIAPADDMVMVAVDVEPASAVVFLDERPVGVGTLRLLLRRGAPTHHLVVAAAGFIRWESYVGDVDLDRTLVLEPLAPAGSPRP